MKILREIVKRSYSEDHQDRIFITIALVALGVVVLCIVLFLIAHYRTMPSFTANDSIKEVNGLSAQQCDTSGFYCDSVSATGVTYPDEQHVDDEKPRVLAVDNYHDIEEMVLKIAKEDIYVGLWRVDEMSNDKWYIIYRVGRNQYLRIINVKKGIYGKMTRLVCEYNGWYHVASDKRKRYEMYKGTLRYYYCNELKASYPTSVMVHIPQPEFTSEEFYEYQEMIEVENCRDEYDEFESYDSYEDYLEDGGFE